MPNSYSVNMVVLSGRVSNVEAVKEVGGQNMLKFSVATNEEIWNRETKKATRIPEFHNIEAWGKLANFAATFIEKGSPVTVIGKLKTRRYQGKDGQKKHYTLVRADEVWPGGDSKGKKSSPQESGDMFDGFGGGQGGDDEVPF